MLRREPSLDFRRAQGALPHGLPDPEVLAASALDDRILVSHDVGSMPGHFGRFLKHAGASPGLILIPQSVPLGVAIQELVLIWAASDHHEWRDRITWLPL